MRIALFLVGAVVGIAAYRLYRVKGLDGVPPGRAAHEGSALRRDAGRRVEGALTGLLFLALGVALGCAFVIIAVSAAIVIAISLLDRCCR